MKKRQKTNILVTASTYPRWENDSVPSFIQQFCAHMATYYQNIYVLVPHYAGSKKKEASGNVQVKRFRYMVPERAQDIVYGGGGVFKIKKSPFYALKLLGFVVSEFWSTFHLSRKVTIINAHWIIPQGFLAVIVKLITGKKVVVSVHGSDIFSLKGRFMTRIKRFTLKHADYVVANSTASLQACRQVYSGVNGSVIPMGTDLSFFKSHNKKTTFMDTYDLERVFTILFIGRLTEVKGVEYLLKALLQLKESGIPFKALIAGDGPEKEKLETYVQDHDLEDVVYFVGWVGKDKIVDFYSSGDVLVGPSLHEAFGLVFVEAQACGLPVVASRINGIPDIVADGKTGLLVTPRSSDDIYQKIRTLYDDRRLLNEMKKNGPRMMGQEFSWESVEERYCKVFESLSK